jgi:hypothetical protein
MKWKIRARHSEIEHHFVEASQAYHACPSDKVSVEVKILRWLEGMVWDKDRGIVCFWIYVVLYKLKNTF